MQWHKTSNFSEHDKIKYGEVNNGIIGCLRSCLAISSTIEPQEQHHEYRISVTRIILVIFTATVLTAFYVMISGAGIQKYQTMFFSFAIFNLCPLFFIFNHAGLKNQLFKTLTQIKNNLQNNTENCLAVLMSIC